MDDIFDDLQAEFLCFKENSNFRLHRQNSDTGVNNYGYRLADFCTDNDLFIIKGRGDMNSSNVTCKNVSTMDYFVSSLSVIPMLQCLHVHEFCELFSDSHNPVSLDMEVAYWYKSSDSSTDTTERTKLWDAEKVQTFISF